MGLKWVEMSSPNPTNHQPLYRIEGLDTCGASFSGASFFNKYIPMLVRYIYVVRYGFM